ncbi:O-acetylhomoserine aminocarboxypropyltransferase/cysteine synthase family protein [Bifidobacterium angulatum]|uniref:O-acetylhomoserine aminocarboxypropyltransferase/cysteine synthase family protein n=1 Tax=Bifidobacterium angulatum TaxID=1683 RepID=UPI0005F8D346|nr:aminotransferase class I/II-fold pyridoxal phosphate-dependent enzyme [Bifidobacterium angulatum]AMK57712.1 O-acetylhomoserine aminocarboxypropyltransferase [Bifidobacterium angulatum]
MSNTTRDHCNSQSHCKDVAAQRFETKAIHAGYDRQANADAVSVPIYASAAFDLENAQRGDALAGGEISGFEYSRVANPTVDALEKRLATLENGVGAVAVSSGMAAVSYALMCVAEGGGRIIAPVNLYGASVDALGDFLPQFGIHGDFITNINDLNAVEAAIGPQTKAIYTETVANPSTAVADIEGLAQLAHKHGIPLIVDNTVPTPYLLRPIDFGADIVVHSTTKGITGHGNAIGGVVVDAGRFDWTNGKFPQFTRDDLVISDQKAGQWNSFASRFGNQAFIKRVRTKYLRTFGAVQSPFNAYLQLVGLETLAVRERQEVASALAIAKHLRGLEHVTRVNYASLEGQGTHDLAQKYLPEGVGTILSFTVEGDANNVQRILDGTEVFSYVPNIGDSRSLIVDPTHVTHREVPQRYYEAAGVGDNLIRLSVGLENVDDLIADLDQAIAGAYAA